MARLTYLSSESRLEEILGNRIGSNELMLQYEQSYLIQKIIGTLPSLNTSIQANSRNPSKKFRHRTDQIQIGVWHLARLFCPSLSFCFPPYLSRSLSLCCSFERLHRTFRAVRGIMHLPVVGKTCLRRPSCRCRFPRAHVL